MNSSKPKVRIGSMLVAQGYISEEQLQQALEEQKATKKKLGQTIIELGFMSLDQFLSVHAEQFNIPYVDLKNIVIDEAVAKLLPEAVARRYSAIPVSKEQLDYLVVLSDPTDIFGMDVIKESVGDNVKWGLAKKEEISSAIDRVYLDGEELFSLASELESELGFIPNLDVELSAVNNGSNDTPIVKFLQRIFEEAIVLRASDIHIEPDEKLIRLRFRVDGILHERTIKEKSISHAVILRLKIMAELNISEKRLPQDGRFKIEVKTKNIDVRLSTLPTQFGESVVMRIFDATSVKMDLSHIGMPENILDKFKFMINRPHGIILVTGPTGSGKTTTLYSVLNSLNAPDKKIITVEDPVEYQISRVQQVQVNAKVGLTFSGVLRSALRQDPDVVLIGEIRDQDTAEIAMKAAMTGHLVLSTLHTNDSISSVARLVDMGVPSYMAASAILAVVAQRLIRKNCLNCLVEDKLSETDLGWVKNISSGRIKDIEETTFKKGSGCRSCHGTGYSGRIGVYELMEMNDRLTHHLIKNEFSEFSEVASSNPGFEPLSMSGLKYAVKGVTSVSEVFKLISVSNFQYSS